MYLVVPVRPSICATVGHHYEVEVFVCVSNNSVDAVDWLLILWYFYQSVQLHINWQYTQRSFERLENMSNMFSMEIQIAQKLLKFYGTF